MSTSASRVAGAIAPVRAATDPFDLSVPAGTLPVAQAPRLEPGRIVRWHFRRHDYPVHGTEVVQPVRVVSHDDRGLVVWLAGGTITAESRLVGWEDVNPHDVPHEVRFVPEPPSRVQLAGSWYGTGVLRIVPADSPFSVWVFRDGGGRFRSWYVNLEAQHRLLVTDPDRAQETPDPGVAARRPEAGNVAELFTADHILDIVVSPDGGTRFKDQDELAGAQGHGMWDSAAVDRVRANADLALAALHDPENPAHWAFDEAWTRWREPEAWTALGREFVEDLLP